MNQSRRVFAFALALCALAVSQSRAQTNNLGTNSFSFVVAGDMRNFTELLPDGRRQFDGACEAMAQVGPGSFIIIPGDFDPPAAVRATLDRIVGTSYVSYFAVGNHDVESKEHMQWLRAWAKAGIPHLVRAGPRGAEASMYSFDFGNSHFVMLSDYFDGKRETKSKAGLSEATLKWLERDLAANRQPLVWLASHMPLKSLPDMDSGRVRHEEDTLVADPRRREQFLSLVRRYRVRGLFNGHTHNCSITKLDGLWQLDSGHARGAGDDGSPSTFLKVRVEGERAWVDVFRASPDGRDYKLRKTVELD
jgi:hypothetical protein